MNEHQLPIVNQALAERVMCAERDAMSDWLEGLRELPGNPFGVEVKPFGNANALIVRALPMSPLYNRVMCLGQDEINLIDEIKQFYREQRVPLCLDLSPYHVTPNLLMSLAKRNLYQAGFHIILYGVPTTDIPDPDPNITIREVRSDEMDIFVNIYEQGFGAGELTRVLYGRPGWRLYIVLLNSVYAGINITYIKDGIASSVDTTTLPTMRRRGCQSTLINYRLKEHALAGCSLMVTQTAVGVVSQANWQRAGLRMVGNHVWWMEMPK